MKQPKHKKIGAVWANQTHAGETYFSGTITIDVAGQSVTVDVSIFANKFKCEGDNKPSHIVYMPAGVELQPDEFPADHPF